MDVIIGVQARDGALRISLGEDEAAALKRSIEEALASPAPTLVWVTDKDGKEYGIPSDKIAFVEFASEKAVRQVGFSSAS